MSIVCPLAEFLSLESRYNACKQRANHPLSLYSLCINTSFVQIVASSSVNKLEDVVENVEAASTIGKELECLAVAHGSLFLVDLVDDIG